MRKKVTKKAFKEAFGGRKNAAEAIGTSVITIDKWAKQGFIPEICKRHTHHGKNWHQIIRDLGFDPVNLSPL